MTMVLPCNCKHEYQDKHYGPGMRVHNKFGEGSDSGFRCTVCKKEKKNLKKEEKDKAK